MGLRGIVPGGFVRFAAANCGSVGYMNTKPTSGYTTIRMDPELREALAKLAAIGERSVSGEIRLALKNWVKPEAVRDRTAK
jgi:hypothetical protein